MSNGITTKELKVLGALAERYRLYLLGSEQILCQARTDDTWHSLQTIAQERYRAVLRQHVLAFLRSITAVVQEVPLITYTGKAAEKLNGRWILRDRDSSFMGDICNVDAARVVRLEPFLAKAQQLSVGPRGKGWGRLIGVLEGVGTVYPADLEPHTSRMLVVCRRQETVWFTVLAHMQAAIPSVLRFRVYRHEHGGMEVRFFDPVPQSFGVVKLENVYRVFKLPKVPDEQ